MNHDLRSRLAASDPLTTEPLPEQADLERMRRAVLAEAARAARPFAPWRSPAWLAAAAVLVVLVFGASRVPPNAPRGGAPANDVAIATRASLETTSRRQVQFVTAGGTRIIWVLNEELDEWNDR